MLVSGAEVVLVVTKLREPRPSTHDSARSGYQKRDRLGFTLYHVLSLSLASLVAGFALLFVWSIEADEQGPVESVSGLSAEGSLPLPEVMEDFDAEALKDQLEEIVLGHEGAYGVAVFEPLSGTRISLGGDEEFMAASIGKLPVLATLYRAGAQGELDLVEEEIPILPEDIRDYGDGELLSFPGDGFLSPRESAYRMINHSNNITWSMLDRRLGTERIRRELEEMGLNSSRYSDNLFGYFTTPNDVLLLLEKIADPRFTSKELSEEMLEAMTETHLEDRIPERLPPNVRVAHKTGSYEENIGDAAIVFYRDSQGIERRYYLVVLSRGTGEYEARDAIQSISLAVYEALTGVNVEHGWARGNAAPLESEVDDEPAPQLDSVENPERYDEENPELPPKSSLDEGPVPVGKQPTPDEESLLESWANVVPDPS